MWLGANFFRTLMAADPKRREKIAHIYMFKSAAPTGNYVIRGVYGVGTKYAVIPK